MLPDPPLFSSIPLVGWVVLAIVAIVVLSVALRIVRKAVRVSIRLAILIGVLVLIAAGVCWGTSLLSSGSLPTT